MSATFDSAPVGAISDLSGSYTFDPSHTRLGFQARHAMVTTVRGHFDRFEGTATIDAAAPSRSSAQVTVHVDSVSTSNEQRDDHLRSSDFFLIEQHPTMTLTTTAVEKVGDDEYAVTGDLTIRGVTKPVTFDVTVTGAARDPYGKIRVGVEGSAVISRKAWGLEWNVPLDTGGFLVSDKVKIEIDIALVKND
jgi:polyisoprenoid-binding protein YceI